MSTAAVCCGGGNSPAPQPTPIPNPPTVSCPADITLVSHQGQSQPTANFDTPSPQEGQAPVTVACSPGSGTAFSNGKTTVTCEATDAMARKASCTFSVEVTPVPRIEKTQFLAFGDSLTEGKTSLRAPGIVVVPPGTFNTPASYVEKLNVKLTARYQDQTVTLVAGGLGGEYAGEGKLRLAGALAVHNPDALLLLEGTNDLLDTAATSASGMQNAINSVVDALQNMIRQGRTRGARVFVATLPPITRSANLAAAVVTLNNRIRSLAVQENATLVDLHAAVPVSLIGSDGLHPIPSAYDTIADEWMKAIAAALEVQVPH